MAALRLYNTAVGTKVLVAASGIILSLHLLFHLSGNLLIFRTPQMENGVTVYRINQYAAFLHGLPSLLWLARAILVVAVLLHISVSVDLWYAARQARPIAYVRKRNLLLALAARTMMWSGPVIAAFVILHILHVTTGSAGLAFRELDDYGRYSAFSIGPSLPHTFSPCCYSQCTYIMGCGV